MRKIKDNTNDTILHFHIGRGGRFYNSNYLTYEGVYNKGLTDFAISGYNGFYAYIEGDDGKTPDEELIGRDLVDENDNRLNAKYGDEVGILDWDGEYDTDIFIYLVDVEYDDKYYNTIMNYDGYTESEVAEYIAQLFIDNELSYYIDINNLPSYDDEYYEQEMDDIIDDACVDIKNSYVRDYIETYIRNLD